MRKVLISVSMAGLLLTGASAWARRSPSQAQSAPPAKPAPKAAAKPATAVRTANGQITALSDTSFNMDVMVAGAKKDMMFAVDKDIKVQGAVQVGAAVTVTYKTLADGKNQAISVTVKPS